MSKAWESLGRFSYWISWPLLHVFLRIGKRTRILAIADNKVLVVRGWLGAGYWSLPGGGLHFGEEPTDGAIRELIEETGITVQPAQLQHQGVRKGVNDQKHRYHFHWFVLELPKPLPIVRQKRELTEVAWVDYRDLLADKRLGKIPRELIQSWYDLT